MPSFSYRLNPDEIANLLNRNFGFRTVEDKKFGVMVEMPVREAFRLSLVHGAPYMISQTGFSLKGRMEVLIHRSVFQNDRYIYAPGLFGRDRESFLQEGDSFLSVKQRYPKIFEGPKFLIFKTIRSGESSNIERSVFQELKDFFGKPSQYLLFKVYEEGTNLEPLFEYLCCRKFAGMGYITENQVPWFQQSFVKNNKQITGGIPDFAAYTAPFMALLEKAFSFKGGMVIQELASMFFEPPAININKNSYNERDRKYKLLLGEVKLSRSQRTQAYDQLERYMQTGLPTTPYSIIYDDVDAPTNKFGSIYIDRNYKIQIRTPADGWKRDLELQRKDQIWLRNYAKFFLLANCTMEKIFQFIGDSAVAKGKRFYSYDLVEALIRRSFDDVVKFVRENMAQDDG